MCEKHSACEVVFCAFWTGLSNVEKCMQGLIWQFVLSCQLFWTLPGAISHLNIMIGIGSFATVATDAGRKEVCHARDSQNWLTRVKSSALVTGFVLAEGTHQTRWLFGEFHAIWIHIYDYRGEGP